MKNKLAAGDRVEHVSLAMTCTTGTVLSADDIRVEVRWDDGHIGLMVWDRRVPYSAYKLLKLRKEVNKDA